jgi:hypothetical protein
MLNSNVLGQALHDAREQFNNKSWEELLQLYGSPEGIRLAAAKADAAANITHFKTDGVLNVPGAGLISSTPGNPVTGTSVTGKIQ